MDENKLINVEAQILIAGLIDINSIINDLDFTDYTCLQKIHRSLFGELYKWAGKFRTINIYKNEAVLNGLSIKYSDKNRIVEDLKAIFHWASQVEWSHENHQLPSQITKLMTDVWRVHPYREGNTRTVSIFIKLFTDKHGISFRAELLSQNASYLRNALVMAAVHEEPEPSYLHRIILDALTLNSSEITKTNKVDSTKYQTIGQYDVTNYEEKPFYTKPDEPQY